MAISPSLKTYETAIQNYRACSSQRAESCTLLKGRAEQELQNKADTVQFSPQALELLEIFKEKQRKDALKEAQFVQENDSKLEKSLKILDPDSDASVEEIRKAYLHAIQKYHPDKHACLPLEFRQLAEIKSKQINELYSTLIKRKTSDLRNC